ncbi:alpha/beta fold hydrolase [Solirubrobacter soli]|uniref:alpha/beta fold hydrolase n=1 Tax=Solirubrobacter soli TaxID=363832 RepID=UPI0009FD938F|nr:alpha/beta fold hydrolase [Solirubrobacter soli]
MIAYTRTGSGEPLVLLHALGTDRHMWDPVIERLSAEREVYAVDMPGFGESAPIEPSAPADLARAVHEGLGLDRPHVAGNSLGGWVALELALAGHARSVTAIAPAGMWERPLQPKRAAARQLARALRPALPTLLRSERGRRLALGGTIARPERVPYAAALQLVRAYANAPGFDAANAAMRAGHFPRLAEIDVPLTLAWPEHDRLVGRPRSVPAVAHEFRLRGCGHMPTWDDPELVADVLLAGSTLTPGDVELAAEQDRDAG